MQLFFPSDLFVTALSSISLHCSTLGVGDINGITLALFNTPLVKHSEMLFKCKFPHPVHLVVILPEFCNIIWFSKNYKSNY